MNSVRSNYQSFNYEKLKILVCCKDLVPFIEFYYKNFEPVGWVYLVTLTSIYSITFILLALFLRRSGWQILIALGKNLEFCNKIKLDEHLLDCTYLGANIFFGKYSIKQTKKIKHFSYFWQALSIGIKIPRFCSIRLGTRFNT